MIGPTNKNNSLFIMFINPKYWNGKLLQWNWSKPNLLGTNFCASYIRTLFKGWFIQDFGLYRISVYSGFSLYRISVYSGFGLDRFHCIFYWNTQIMQIKPQVSTNIYASHAPCKSFVWFSFQKINQIKWHWNWN